MKHIPKKYFFLERGIKLKLILSAHGTGRPTASTSTAATTEMLDTNLNQLHEKTKKIRALSAAETLWFVSRHWNSAATQWKEVYQGV